MKINTDKIVLECFLTDDEIIKVAPYIRRSIKNEELLENFIYIYADSIYSIVIHTIPDVDVYWLAGKLEVEDRESVMCLSNFQGFWSELKDVLYLNKINDYKRYGVFTKGDLIGSGERTWEEYVGESEEDAMEYFSDILEIKDIQSIIEIRDEEEEEGF